MFSRNIRIIALTSVLLFQATFAWASSASPSQLPPDSILSPALQRLALALANDPGIASAHFWDDVKRVGTPLIEPSSVPGCKLVTFVYRGTDTTRSVVVMTSDHVQLANDAYLHLGKMHHLSGTDVWFRSYTLRSDARFSYMFSHNDPLVSLAGQTPGGARARNAGLSPDPLNAKLFASRNGTASIAELPDAPRDPLADTLPNEPRGSIDSVAFRSAADHFTRILRVYHPSRGVPAVLIVALDGETYRDAIPLPRTLDHLAATGQFKNAAAVLIGDGPEHLKDMWYSEDYARVVAEEIVPFVKKRFGMSAGTRTLIVGSSISGSAAVFIAHRYERVFSGVLAQSGGFQYPRTQAEMGTATVAGQLFEPAFPQREWLAAELAHAAHVPCVYLDIGLMEDVAWGFTPPKYALVSTLVATRHLRDVLTARGARLGYHEFAGIHEELSWHYSFADGLLWLVKNCVQLPG